jgi:hypothetical protein
MYADHTGVGQTSVQEPLRAPLNASLVSNRFKLKGIFVPRGNSPCTRWRNDQRTRSWALRNVSMHFFRPIRSSFDSGGSRTLRHPPRPTTPGSESVTPSCEL